MIDEILKYIDEQIETWTKIDKHHTIIDKLKALRVAIEHIDYLENLYDYAPNHRTNEIATILGVKEGEK